MSTSPATKAKRPKWIYAVGAIAVLGLCGIITQMGGDKDGQQAAAPKPGETAAPTAAPTDAPLAPSIADMQAKRKTATDLQWDNYRKPLEGAAVRDWHGLVTDVSAKGDRFKVSVDLDNNPDFSVADTFVTVDNPDAVNWPKGAPVIINGTIDNVDSLLGSVYVTLADGATIVAAP